MNERLKNKLNIVFSSRLTHSKELELSSHANAGAAEFAIRKAAVNLPVALPKDYSDFLQYANGCTIYNYHDLDGFCFFGIDELQKRTNDVQEIYDNEWDQAIIVFCSILGEGNFIGFRVLDETTYEILDCFHEYLPAEWEVIGTSFDEFLEKLIDLKGKKYWLS